MAEPEQQVSGACFTDMAALGKWTECIVAKVVALHSSVDLTSGYCPESAPVTKAPITKHDTSCFASTSNTDGDRFYMGQATALNLAVTCDNCHHNVISRSSEHHYC